MARASPQMGGVSSQTWDGLRVPQIRLGMLCTVGAHGWCQRARKRVLGSD